MSSFSCFSKSFRFFLPPYGTALHLQSISRHSYPMSMKIPAFSLVFHAPKRGKLYVAQSGSLSLSFLDSLSLHSEISSCIQAGNRRDKIAALGFGRKSVFGHFIDYRGISVRSSENRDDGTVRATKQLSLSVPVIVEQSLPVSAELEAMVDQIQLDGELLLEHTMRNYKLAESADSVELSVLLCDDKYIQKLNKQWLRKNSPTDVLSFPINEVPGLSSLLLLGDIVISLETAKEQAEERGHNLLDEVRILLVHGLLHILGYDHERGPDAAKEMEEEEQQLLNKLGWTGKGLIQASVEVDEKP